MGSEDPFKGVDWKAVGTELQKDPSSKPVIKKRLPKKMREIPEWYFLPRRSLPSAIGFYGACIAGGIGAGMLLEIWINKKIKGLSLPLMFYIYCAFVILELLNLFSPQVCISSRQIYIYIYFLLA